MGMSVLKKVKENKIQLLSLFAVISYIFSLLFIIRLGGYIKMCLFLVNPIFIFPPAFLLFRKERTIFSFTFFICAFLTILFPLEYFIQADIWQNVLIAPIGEEALKFSISFLLTFLFSKSYFKINFNMQFVVFSFLVSGYFGMVEYIGYEDVWNIIAHLSFTLLGTIIMSSYFHLLQFPNKKRFDYGLSFLVMPFFIISLSMVSHSISNMIASNWGLGRIITDQASYIASLSLSLVVLAISIVAIMLIKIILKPLLGHLTKISRWAEKHRTEIGITCMSYIGLFILNLFTGESHPVLVVLMVFVVILSGIIWLSYNYDSLSQRYIKERFRYSKIGVLDGSITGNKFKIPEKTVFEPKEWEKILKKKNLNVELISVSKISDEYSMIINPFGGSYIEEDLTNLKTLKKIKDYINNGGVFINSSDLAFWHSWHSERAVEGLTSQGVETLSFDAGYRSLNKYIETENKIIFTPIISGGSLVDTWLYNNFGIRTTLGGKMSLKVTPTVEFLRTIGETKINVFRAALTCEKEDSFLIGLVSAKYGKNRECYPVAAIHQGIGYLILFGIALDERKKEDFEWECLIIGLLHDKLAENGSLTR